MLQNCFIQFAKKRGGEENMKILTLNRIRKAGYRKQTIQLQNGEHSTKIFSINARKIQLYCPKVTYSLTNLLISF